MLNCFVVGIGGFLGAVLRYLFGMIPIKNSAGFPINTLIINIIGAFIIGLITAFTLKSGSTDDKLLLFLRVGICGGFTTFSTFSLESFRLFQEGKVTVGLIYIVSSIIFCVGAVYASQAMVKLSIH